jgi:hypothetical protein
VEQEILHQFLLLKVVLAVVDQDLVLMVALLVAEVLWQLERMLLQAQIKQVVLVGDFQQQHLVQVAHLIVAFNIFLVVGKVVVIHLQVHKRML